MTTVKSRHDGRQVERGRREEVDVVQGWVLGREKSCNQWQGERQGSETRKVHWRDAWDCEREKR